MSFRPSFRALSALVVVSSSVGAQAPDTTTRSLPPATKLEAFRPAAGSVLTMGYNALGAVQGISLTVRELRDSRGGMARGLVVEVYQSQYREERSFVDEDELAELLAGIDALLEVRTNPTKFQLFEVRYTTRGELQVTAFNDRTGRVQYALEVGRTLKAQKFGLTDQHVRQVRAMIEAGRELLRTMAVK